MAWIPRPGAKIEGPSGPDTLELVKPLGQGFFGVVWEAKDTSNAATVAVKFPQVRALSGGPLQAFNNELMAAAKVAHPNVVRVLFTADPNAPAGPGLR